MRLFAALLISHEAESLNEHENSSFRVSGYEIYPNNPGNSSEIFLSRTFSIRRDTAGYYDLVAGNACIDSHIEALKTSQRKGYDDCFYLQPNSRDKDGDKACGWSSSRMIVTNIEASLDQENNYCYGSMTVPFARPEGPYMIQFGGNNQQQTWVDFTDDTATIQPGSAFQSRAYVWDHDNTTPQVKVPAEWRVLAGCSGQTLKLSPVDVDGDMVRCRWADAIDDVKSVFHDTSLYSSLTLDEERCIITYDGTMDESSEGYKPIAIQVEDFDAGGIVLSSMPVQFAAKLWTSTERNHCWLTPYFRLDTPADGTMLDARNGVQIVIKAFSVGDEEYVKGFQFNSPLGMDCSYEPDEIDDFDGAIRVATCNWSPTPVQMDLANNFCFSAEDVKGYMSERRCIVLDTREPPGTWGEWGQFSSCSTTCGPGQKSRDRVCENGVDCDETETGAQETADCDEKACVMDECRDGQHDCDHTQRCQDTPDFYTCVDMDECAYGTHNCALTDECTNTIGSFTCSPIIGTWSQWSAVSPCSVTCGPGSKYRNRVCKDGVDCDETEAGDQEEDVCEEKACIMDECRDGQHDCDDTQRCQDTPDFYTCVDMDECAYGTHNCALTDECTNTIGSFTCSPIIGTWSQWSPVSPCSVTCGPGSKYRNRVCEDGVDCDETEAGNQEEDVCEDTICGPNPCPSTECWTHDASTNTCTIKAECATLTCGATAFDVTFKSGLFNLDDNQSLVTMAGGVISPVWDGSQWTANTPLGENGMTYAVDANKNEVTFAIKFAIVGDDMKTRSDDVQDNIIELGALSVVTTPFGAAVVFSCTYSMTIDVASQDYTVTGASVVDTFNGVGSLAAGFTMTLDNGGSPAFLLGSKMPVAITWSVTALSNLQFYLETCTVIHGTTTIKVVKDGCYSATLGVESTEPVTSAEQGFSYQIFKGVGETDPQQTIECSVNICEVGKCNNPTANNQCPATGDDAHYGYKI